MTTKERARIGGRHLSFKSGLQLLTVYRVGIMSPGHKADVGQYLEGAIEIILGLAPSYSILCKTDFFQSMLCQRDSVLQATVVSSSRIEGVSLLGWTLKWHYLSRIILAGQTHKWFVPGNRKSDNM